MRANSKTVVLKIGGSIGEEGTVLEDIVALAKQGIRPVIVHGGGPRITSMLAQVGVETRFVQGRRYTDETTLEIAHMVLMRINGQFVAHLNQAGLPAIGLNGLDARLLQARLRDPALGLVGEVEHVNAPFLHALLDQGLVPIIAPLAFGPDGQVLNVNADTVAGEIARALAAEEFVLFTDVPGVLDSQKHVLPSLTRDQVEALIQDGTIHGGMLPKIESCLRAQETVPRARILDGREVRALPRALLSEEPIGTTLEASAHAMGGLGGAAPQNQKVSPSLGRGQGVGKTP